jgi:hypothetical protein
MCVFIFCADLPPYRPLMRGKCPRISRKASIEIPHILTAFQHSERRLDEGIGS